MKNKNVGRKVTVQSDGYPVAGKIVREDGKDRFIVEVPVDSTQPKKGNKEVSRHRSEITWR